MKLGVDIGGTFTDFVLLDETTGRLFSEKVLTTPDDPSRGVLQGIDSILTKNGLYPGAVRQVIHGTTLVANALIERKGVKTALVTSRGFRDVLEIGREWRYDIYDLDIDVVTPLVPRSLRFEVPERIGPDGAVLEPLDLAALATVAGRLRRASVRAVAVSFLHAYRNAEHERQAKIMLAQALPGVTVCVSSDVMPILGEYERTSTTVANAYVQPIFEAYVRRLVSGLVEAGVKGELYLMQSDGGMVHHSTAVEHPIRFVQSGPAGGVHAASLIGRLANEADVLCFDMGGTTAKAALVEKGEPTRATDFEVARVYRFKRGSGLPVRLPAIDMIEIGAGGGSIASVNRLGLIEVGPESSGAEPGPACYGLGGSEATVTDADLVLGYLDAGSFLGGDMPLDVAAAHRAIEKAVARPLGLSVVEAAWGIQETVSENMSQAATIHCLEKGKRASDFVLIPIGGAGPVHACRVATKLGMRRVICPFGAGVASAFGFLASPFAFDAVHASFSPLETLDWNQSAEIIGRLQARGRELLRSSGVSEAALQVRVLCAMRYTGQGYELEVSVPSEVLERRQEEGLRARFEEEYRALYGRVQTGMRCEVVSWRVVVASPYPDVWPEPSQAHGDLDQARKGMRQLYDNGTRRFVEAPVFDRYALPTGASGTGPAIIEERESTVVVPASSTWTVDAHRNLIIDLR